MTETTGEIKATPRPFEENAYKYADEQAELYRGLKEPSGGYALIVDAYIVGAKRETTELEAQIEKMKCCLSTWYEYENERDTPQINIDELLTETQQLIS